MSEDLQEPASAFDNELDPEDQQHLMAEIIDNQDEEYNEDD
jgi:hypothetical protein